VRNLLCFLGIVLFLGSLGAGNALAATLTDTEIVADPNWYCLYGAPQTTNFKSTGIGASPTVVDRQGFSSMSGLAWLNAPAPGTSFDKIAVHLKVHDGNADGNPTTQYSFTMQVKVYRWDLTGATQTARCQNTVNGTPIASSEVMSATTNIGAGIIQPWFWWTVDLGQQVPWDTQGYAWTLTINSTYTGKNLVNVGHDTNNNYATNDPNAGNVFYNSSYAARNWADETAIHVVPEPAMTGILALGGLLMAARRRRRV
jgi:hypothetical protein